MSDVTQREHHRHFQERRRNRLRIIRIVGTRRKFCLQARVYVAEQGAVYLGKATAFFVIFLCLRFVDSRTERKINQRFIQIVDFIFHGSARDGDDIPDKRFRVKIDRFSVVRILLILRGKFVRGKSVMTIILAQQLDVSVGTTRAAERQQLAIHAIFQHQFVIRFRHLVGSIQLVAQRLASVKHTPIILRRSDRRHRKIVHFQLDGNFRRPIVEPHGRTPSIQSRRYVLPYPNIHIKALVMPCRNRILSLCTDRSERNQRIGNSRAR